MRTRHSGPAGRAGIGHPSGRVRRRAARARLAAIAALAALATLIGGCAGPTPVPNPQPSPKDPPPAVQETQITRILSDLSEQLTASAKANSLNGVTRLGGVALTMRQAQLTRYAADPTDASAAPDQLGTTFKGEIVAATDKWPRYFIAVTEPDAQLRQYMYLLGQKDARSQYQMDSWVRLVAPVTLPTTAKASVGSPVVDVNAAGLVASPAEAVTAYAAATSDSAGAAAGEFAGTVDPARQAWTELVAQWSSTIALLKGNVTQSTASVAGGTVALGTADGGALVFGQVASTLKVSFTRTNKAQSFSLRPGIAALGAASATVTKAATAQYDTTVAMYVPPAGAGQKITVLGAAQAPVSVATEAAQ
jgi:hypothetical protein